MPACLTHYFFSQNVREDLKDKAELDPCAYAWGAQGPDFFFCHRFLPIWKGESLREYGGRLHEERPSKVLGSMRSFLQDHPDPAIRSYVWGFVPLLFRLYRTSLHQLAGSRACKAAPLGDPLYHARGD